MRYKIDRNRFIMVCPARLIWVKGIGSFLNLIEKVENKEEVTLLLVGEGKLREELMVQADIAKADVRFLGYKSQGELIEIYSVSKCLIMPSLSDAYPLSCIEALWCGLPLLLSDKVGNYPEVLIEEKNGNIFSYEREEEAIKIIEQMIDKDQAWLENAGKISKQIAKEQFDIDKVSKLLVKNMIKNN